MRSWWFAWPALFLGCLPVQEGSGVLFERVLPLTAFGTLVVHAPVPVVLHLGDAPSAVLTCDDNLINLVAADVNDGVLTVRVDRRVQIVPSEGCVLDLAVPALARVITTSDRTLIIDGQAVHTLAEVVSSGHGGVHVLDPLATPALDVLATGAGPVEIAAVHTPRLSILADGDGSARISGHADALSVAHDGAGSVQLRHLVATDAIVGLSGDGSAELQVVGTLDVELTGDGDVRVWGSPDVVGENRSGSGEVVWED